MKLFGQIVLGAIAFVLLTFGLNYYGLISTGFFAPKYRAIENKVFKESEQYNDGMVRDLENLKMQYLTANDDQKLALKATIIHRFSVYKEDNLTPELKLFYSKLKGDL